MVLRGPRVRLQAGRAHLLVRVLVQDVDVAAARVPLRVGVLLRVRGRRARSGVCVSKGLAGLTKGALRQSLRTARWLYPL